jgi:zinc/manganese transport system permease protein
MARHRLAASWVIAALGYAVGLVVSTLTDLPSGPVIVWALVVLALIAFMSMNRWSAART